jgi:hypothetical protein
MNAPGPQGSPAETIACLNALAIELSAYGWKANVQKLHGKPPTLHAQNPEPGAAALSEHIYARPLADGSWAYWWPWTQPIAETAADAAAIIVRVLRSADTLTTKPVGHGAGDSASSGHASCSTNSPRERTRVPSQARTHDETDLEMALRDAEQFLARSCQAVHPGLATRTMLRYLNGYRAHLCALVSASRHHLQATPD